MRTRLQILLLGISIFVANARAGELSDFTQQTMAEVVKIARAISVVQPYLEETKYVEYALGIFRASRRYDIDPNILIAIGQTETAFREGLPEGDAGEWGICQIRKNWLNNAQFRAEFGKQTIKDLDHPSKNFLFAAWILRDLKGTIKTKTLPFWSFYNSRKFENRFKYFLLVNKNLASLRRFAAMQRGGIRSVRGPATPGPSLRGGDLPFAKAPSRGSETAITETPALPEAKAPTDDLAPAKSLVAPEARSAFTLQPREGRFGLPSVSAYRRPATSPAPSSLAEATSGSYWSPTVKVSPAGNRADGGSERAVAD